MTQQGAIKSPVGPQAVFCVCCDDDTVNTVAAVTATAQGFFFAGAFGDYITPERRPQFPPSVKAAGECVALIGFDQDAELALRTVDRLNQIFNYRVHVVGVGGTPGESLLLRAMRAGCVEFLERSAVLTELEVALRRFQLVPKVTAAEQNRAGRILAFFGAKGGVGADDAGRAPGHAPGTDTRETDASDRPQASARACGAVPWPAQHAISL